MGREGEREREGGGGGGGERETVITEPQTDPANQPLKNVEQIDELT